MGLAVAILEQIPSEIINLVLKYSKEVRNLVKCLRIGISMLNQVRVGEALRALSECIRADTRADKIRRDILYKIGTAIKDGNIRESIVRLIRRLDLISEWSKEASRYLTIIPYLEIPVELREKMEELSKYSLESVDVLVNAIEALLEGDMDRANAHASRVEQLEEEADEVDVVARKFLLAMGERISNPALVVMLRDFIESLESIVDYAEDAADYVRALVIRFRE